MTNPPPRSAVHAHSAVDPLPEPRLPRSRFLRPGYDAAQVDGFVEELRRSARSRPPTMSVSDVVDRRFEVSRLGRTYSLSAVDDYLDRAAEILRERGAEPGVPARRPVRTWWIYLVALLLVGVIVGYAATQLWT